MMRKLALVAALAVTSGCASSSSTPSTPMVTVAQISQVKPVQAITTEGQRQSLMDAVTPTNKVPVDLRFTITNPLQEPVTLKGIEMETVGFSGGYSMKRVRHSFDQNVAAGATSTIDVRAWVQPLQETESGRITSPVMITGIARFDLGGKTVRRSFSAKLAQDAQ